MSTWFEAVRALESAAARDFLLVLLFTGMRRQEALSLRWENIDLGNRTLEVPETKNYEPLVLTLSDFLTQLFSERNQQAGAREWVFPGRSARGHLQEPKKYMQKVREQSGVDFRLHDLRRTFITVAEGLDFSMYAVKRLLNHSMSGDVATGYIVSDVERLRKPMQSITDALLRHARPATAEPEGLRAAE